MGIKSALTVATAVAGLTAAPIALAGTADAKPVWTPPFSVSVLHCGGGIAVQAYPTLVKALAAEKAAVTAALKHPLSLHTIQLRKGNKVIVSVSKHC